MRTHDAKWIHVDCVGADVRLVNLSVGVGQAGFSDCFSIIMRALKWTGLMHCLQQEF